MKARGPFLKKRRANGTPGRRDLRGWLDTRSRHDRGRKQQPRPMCNCGAYKYPLSESEKKRRVKARNRPHRLFAGKCADTMGAWVESFFDPFKDDCRDCGCLDESNMSCQVVDGLEGDLHCPALREYIRYEGITLYGKARKAFERVTGTGMRRHHG